METATIERSRVAAEIEHAEEKASAIYTLLSSLLGPAAGLLIWLMPLDLNPSAQSALAIVTFMAIYWIMEPVDHAITALMGCYLFWALGAANFSVAFSGFASSTPWFLFGALLMGEAASRVGLSNRVGYFFLSKSAVSYSGLLFGIITLSFVLCFFIPSGIK